MAKKPNDFQVKLIPVDQINVPNPRVRNQKAFRLIVDSIASVGLKKPITVRRRKTRNSKYSYDLVCGQGRLEAFQSLGETKIPAIEIEATRNDSLIMSLVENLARRQHKPLELLHDIAAQKKRGHSEKAIARRTGLTHDYVQAICRLFDNGEERLLAAVESNQIPLSVALEIADTDDDGVREALADAYKRGLLRGKKLLAAKKIVEHRQNRGKEIGPASRQRDRRRISSQALVRAYERESDRQRLFIKKAELTQNRLLFVIEAVRTLLADENFTTLLRAESIESIPRPLADLVTARGVEQ